jgi:GntR family transcriptional regulator of arabinose operon
MMKTPLYRQIYLHIIKEIRAGNLKPGDRVSSENELADRFSVSRITSKKALEELAQDGVIVRVQGQGSFVQDQLPDLTQVLADIEEANSIHFGEQKKASILGFMMPDFGDVYGTRLFRAIEQRSTQMGYQLLVRLTYGQSETETQGIRALVEAGVAGLIIFPIAGEYYNPVLLRLALDGFPLVVVDRYLKGIPAHAVHTDNVEAAYELTNFLLDRGHTHIAFISPPAEDTSTIEERIQGFTQAFSHRGLSLDPSYCFDQLISTLPQSFNTQNVQVDKARLQSFIQQNPNLSAFVASEYNVALVARQALVDMGKSIPEDFAVVCFDSPENPLAPSLFTHIQQDEATMGLVAVDTLDALIRSEKVEIKTVIDYSLVEGTST